MLWHRNKAILFLLGMLCLSVPLKAQSADSLSSIVGKVFFRMETASPSRPDETLALDIPVSGVDVTLEAAGDTLRTQTDNFGGFTFSGIVPSRVTLSMQGDEYAPFSESFMLMPGENVVIVPRRRSEVLDAAVVSAETPVMTMKGDTLVYHAAALTVGEGDFAIDLLKQMPGVEVENGLILVSGKDVVRSYVNGALIFGLDPLASMQNLKASQVVAMEVYDEKDPMEVLDHQPREKQRVINIRTKDPIFNTTDLQARALAGADETRQDDGNLQYRYAAGANAHFFSELVQLAADVVTNNVGIRSSDITTSLGPQSTYKEATDLRLEFNRYWKNPIFGNGLNTNYSFSHESTRSRNRSMQEYFETAGIPSHTQEEDILSSGTIERHTLNTQFAYRTGKHAFVRWGQQLNLARNSSNELSTGAITYAGMNPMLQDKTSSSENQSWTLNETFFVGFKNGSGKPLPTINLTVLLGKNNLDSWDLDTLASSYSKRYLTKSGDGLQSTLSGSLEQTLYSVRKDDRIFRLNGRYSVNYSRQNLVQEAYDLYGVAEPVLNLVNTYDYTYSDLNQGLLLSSYFQPRIKAIQSVNLRLSFNMDKIVDLERVPTSNPVDKTYYGLYPSLTVITGNLIWSIYSSSRIPSLEQLRRRIDDTKPLSLRAGNPDLNQSRIWSFELRKSSNLSAEKWVMGWSANVKYESNPLVQRTLFFTETTVLKDYDDYCVPAGASLYRTENADYALTAEAGIDVSSRLSMLNGKLKPTVTLRPKVDYRMQPQYFGEILDRLSEWTPSMNATLTMPLRPGTTASLVGTLSYTSATSREGQMDQKLIRGQLEADMTAEFLKYAYWSGTYSWQPVRNLSMPDLNRDFHQLNIALGVKLLEKTLNISLRGIDLLRNGSVYSVVVGPSSVSHTWTSLYGRYFLLDISYRFNNSGGKKMPHYGL